MKYRALICRKADGEQQFSPWYDASGDDQKSPALILFSWRQNNFSCDCNRHLEFERGRGTPEDAIWDEIKCGNKLYDVLHFETDDGRVADERRCEWVKA